MTKGFLSSFASFSGICRAISGVLLMLVLIGFSGTLSAQVVATFKDHSDFLKTDNGQYLTVFLVDADKETYNRLVSNAQTMPETFSFNAIKIEKNTYQFSILFSHPTELSYVKKTLLCIGIDELKINNQLFKLPEYDPVY